MHSSAACYFRAPSAAIFDIFAASGESIAWVFLWKTRSTPIGVSVCLVAPFDFQHRIWPACVDDGCILDRMTRDASSHFFHLRTKEEMRPALHHRQYLPSMMIMMFLSFKTSWTLSWTTRSLDPPDNPEFPPVLPPVPPPAGGERTRAVDQSRGWSRPRSPLPDPQLVHIPMSDGDDDQPPLTIRQRHRSWSRERPCPHAQVPEEPQVQLVIITELGTDPDEHPTFVNPSSWTGISPPVE